MAFPVTDAGRLIADARVDALGLLCELFGRGLMPEAVEPECCARPASHRHRARALGCRAAGPDRERGGHPRADAHERLPRFRGASLGDERRLARHAASAERNPRSSAADRVKAILRWPAPCLRGLEASDPSPFAPGFALPGRSALETRALTTAITIMIRAQNQCDGSQEANPDSARLSLDP